MILSDNSFTTDTFFKGKLKVTQQKDGYRYSIDAVLLANHVKPKYADKIVEFGTGCGIIPLILAFKNKNISISGIEIQKSLSELAELNVQANNMFEQIKIIQGDFRKIDDIIPLKPADIVISNPPYRKAGTGKLNTNYEKQIARHEIESSLQDILQSANKILRVEGKLIIIYPAQRITDLFYEMRNYNIEPKTLRTIHSKNDSEAKLILVEGIKTGRSGMKILQPLFIYNNNGSYTEELEEMFLG